MLLAKVHEICPHLVVTGFTMQNPADVPDYDTYQKVAAAENLEFIDIRPSFKKKVIYKIPMDGHWNERGHEEAATALFRPLADRKELQSPNHRVQTARAE